MPRRGVILGGRSFCSPQAVSGVLALISMICMFVSVSLKPGTASFMMALWALRSKSGTGGRDLFWIMAQDISCRLMGRTPGGGLSGYL